LSPAVAGLQPLFAVGLLSVGRAYAERGNNVFIVGADMNVTIFDRSGDLVRQYDHNAKQYYGDIDNWIVYQNGNVIGHRKGTPENSLDLIDYYRLKDFASFNPFEQSNTQNEQYNNPWIQSLTKNFLEKVYKEAKQQLLNKIIDDK
jgi:hypothetical protein